jgi:hypothetical protein
MVIDLLEPRLDSSRTDRQAMDAETTGISQRVAPARRNRAAERTGS